MNRDRKPESPAEEPADESAHDPLALLEVIDVLEVGPARIDRDRLTVPYVVHTDGHEDKCYLSYRWEEPVFDPNEPASQNLASMIGAQVAINYGLFCRRIVFNGVFDDTDRRFIQEMTENTAREIYVKKFLEYNPFLLGDARNLPAEKRQSYVRATLEFPGAPTGTSTRSRWKLWPTDRERHAVLSSGGKDSLLSYGLLNEIGRETHPIFVNESGRHWFTALNAYRYFKEHVPNTARVWVNSDRVFAWMLRHLPFIRQDFANVRSDNYPIRLWTVAVFLFGALPLARKRGVGRLLIGDEHDSTNRTSFKGIPHYDGYYDQSRYFDNTLSLYFLRKGWSISQFSILRPLSELLIEKILAERYPDLQEYQVSCHATHKKGGRVRPCGKCEKCRRIVGMLSAIGADPTRCGYTPAQIEQCLADVAVRGTHQEAPGIEHMLHLLDQRGLLPKDSAQEHRPAAPHAEIAKLRFDRRRSPIDGVPDDLREPLYRIFLEHADGAVRRVRRDWEPFDPLLDPSLFTPYPFEFQSHRRSKAEEAGHVMPQRINPSIWGELTWPEAEDRIKKVDIALLPVGAIEQHGPHLPLDNDAFDADYLARRVAEACSDPKPFVLPLISYGVSYLHDDFPGTISITNDSLSRLVYEIGVCLARNGIRKIVIINGHGGNQSALNYAAQMINRDTRIFVCVDTGETSDVDVYDLVETPNDVHAGEIETSTTLVTRPHLVRMKDAKPFIPQFSSRYLNFTSQRGVPWHAYTEKISPTGVMGDPTKATEDKGKKIWQVMVAHLVALVEDLKHMTLDEIYQRKY
jgi:creatinine amidohydrolase/Fe(II)-dependent formamide hydrolase-like protein/7-cyano-7-deazaguanine synthase in queuosine biosynthesis